MKTRIFFRQERLVKHAKTGIESLSDAEEEDRALVEKTKEKEKKEKKNLVFEIKLSENANSQYEYNYKDMVRSSEHTLNTL